MCIRIGTYTNNTAFRLSPPWHQPIEIKKLDREKVIEKVRKHYTKQQLQK